MSALRSGSQCPFQPHERGYTAWMLWAKLKRMGKAGKEPTPETMQLGISTGHHKKKKCPGRRKADPPIDDNKPPPRIYRDPRVLLRRAGHRFGIGS